MRDGGEIRPRGHHEGRYDPLSDGWGVKMGRLGLHGEKPGVGYPIRYWDIVSFRKRAPPENIG